MSVWDALDIPYGSIGGFAAALIIIFPLWYLNHNVGLVYDAPGSGFGDMGMGIGLTGIFRDFFMNGADFSLLAETLPTFSLVVIDAIIGGLIAEAVEKDFALDLEKEEVDKHKEGSDA